MKKLFLIALLALLPLTAHAQTTIPDSFVQGVADDLRPAFCKNDLIKASEAVEECFKRVDKDVAHKEVNKCVIEDIFVLGLIKQKEKQLLEQQIASPYSGLDYMKGSNIKARVNKYPNFTQEHDEALEKKAMMTAGKAAFLLKKEGCFDMDKLK